MNTTIGQALGQASRYFVSGQFSLAEQICEFILKQEPNHAEALHLLGVIAHQQGKPLLALDYLRRAVACPGANAVHWNNLGFFHSLVGNHDEAAAACEQALRLRPDYAEAHNNLGIAWQQRGQWERAASCYQQATRFKPTYAEAFNNLGNACKEQGRRPEALAAYLQAVALQPTYAVAFNNLGIILQEQGDHPQATTCYREALRLKPDFALSSNNLATALKEQGRLEESLAQFRETLKIQPDQVLACYNLSQFAAQGWYQFGTDELDRIKARLVDGRDAALDRSLFAFTLAGVLEQQGCADEAFEYYRLANDLRKHLLQENQRAFDAHQHQLFVDRVIALFDRAYFQRVRDWGTDTELPVFVIGMPRSGSTLVEQILSSHPEVFGAGELGEFPQLMTQMAKEASSPDPFHDAVSLRDRALAQDLAAGYLRRLAQLGGQAARVTVKTLENFLYLGVIATLFPRAQIIHCRRDPLDTCLSCYFQNFQRVNFAWSLEDIGAYYCQYERLMAHWRQVLPVPIHDVSYEELIHHQEAVTRKLVACCGLSWDERCLAFYHNPRTVQTASTLQVRRPLYTQSIGRWQRFRRHLGPLLTALGPAAGNPLETHSEGNPTPCEMTLHG